MKKHTKKVFLLILTVCLTLFIFTGCTKKYEAKPLTTIPVTLDDKKIIIGETTVQDLIDNDFTISREESLKTDVTLETPIEKRGYCTLFYFGKDNTLYGTFDVINIKNEDTELSQCIIYALHYNNNDTTNISVYNTNFNNMTLENVDKSLEGTFDTKNDTKDEQGNVNEREYKFGYSSLKFQVNLENQKVASVDIATSTDCY